MLTDIVEVRPVGGYRLFVRFEDGVAGEVDLEPILRFDGVFAPLRDPARFAEARVEPELGTIVWPSGADLCPDVVRARLTGVPVPGSSRAVAS